MIDPFSKRGRILIADDDVELCGLLSGELNADNFETEFVLDGKEAIEKFKQFNYDVVLLDLEMRKVQGEDVLKYAKENKPHLQVVVLTGKTDTRTAVECIKMGAYDFVTKPYQYNQLLLIIDRALEHRRLKLQTEILSSKIDHVSPQVIIGESKNFKQILELAKRASSTDTNILLFSETGTGKELLAEYIHQNSSRKEKPFLTINCASLPDNLIESELFGYEKGAFTDARNTKQGLVEIADGGTLLLDEIGDFAISMQPKLLRFLENGEFRRVGGTRTLRSNVRIIAATNRDLEEAVNSRLFRSDLLYRLNVITLTLPPLKDRREDILILADYFLKKFAPVRMPKTLSEEAKNELLAYSVPGNIRELKHIIERALIFSSGKIISAVDINLPSTIKSILSGASIPENVEKLVEVEKFHIRRMLKKYGWHRTKTYTALGISQKSLYTKIKKYGLTEDNE